MSEVSGLQAKGEWASSYLYLCIVLSLPLHLVRVASSLESCDFFPKSEKHPLSVPVPCAWGPSGSLLDTWASRSPFSSLFHCCYYSQHLIFLQSPDSCLVLVCRTFICFSPECGSVLDLFHYSPRALPALAVLVPMKLLYPHTPLYP